MDWSERADDTSWTEHARGFIVDGDGNGCRASGTMTDNVSESADSIPLQTHTLKEFEQHLNDLKKENFSLKLRIYFLEERIQQKFEDSSDNVYRTVSGSEVNAALRPPSNPAAAAHPGLLEKWGETGLEL
ncbi:putative myomegalin-like [Triplophysa rosa]|uniref:Myomegalin-like n=2 Tax=Triplophysa rosa TaxID=992332 RepID=A0A9W7T4H6_TRIRA|nr:putative myomegalin-like [Triplophysa rosa]